MRPAGVRKVAAAVLEAAGLALIALGLWLAWEPLGVIAAGLALLNFAYGGDR